MERGIYQPNVLPLRLRLCSLRLFLNLGFLIKFLFLLPRLFLSLGFSVAEGKKGVLL